jgi:glycosyltransferase involved in cell wall biosynthesis
VDKHTSVKISVVTAVYNRTATIGEAMESVRSQTHVNIEHVVQVGGVSNRPLARIIRKSREDYRALRNTASVVLAP